MNWYTKYQNQKQYYIYNAGMFYPKEYYYRRH